MALSEQEKREKITNFIVNLQPLWASFLQSEPTVPDPELVELLNEEVAVEVVNLDLDEGSLVLAKMLLSEFLGTQEIDDEELIATVQEILQMPVSTEFSQGFMVLQFALEDLGVHIKLLSELAENQEYIQ